eukprot:CAMPEP_0178997696 /NCGR_PEP_ID=MMETSP0795-20121207/9098_1 /TAXON_ID=88552 /ORGANISM="Amoebophrya sp., Strain Ameob2" /LENGTH=1359 /DNA_ID=CAMNT_0020690287 /DNA_START=31 /DNA_END=4113 /DNA_ORIENTATION=-
MAASTFTEFSVVVPDVKAQKIAVKVPITGEKLRLQVPVGVPPGAKLNLSLQPDGKWRCVASWPNKTDLETVHETVSECSQTLEEIFGEDEVRDSCTTDVLDITADEVQQLRACLAQQLQKTEVPDGENDLQERLLPGTVAPRPSRFVEPPTEAELFYSPAVHPRVVEGGAGRGSDVVAAARASVEYEDALDAASAGFTDDHNEFPAQPNSRGSPGHEDSRDQDEDTVDIVQTLVARASARIMSAEEHADDVEGVQELRTSEGALNDQAQLELAEAALCGPHSPSPIEPALCQDSQPRATAGSPVSEKSSVASSSDRSFVSSKQSPLSAENAAGNNKLQALQSLTEEFGRKYNMDADIDELYGIPSVGLTYGTEQSERLLAAFPPEKAYTKNRYDLDIITSLNDRRQSMNQLRERLQEEKLSRVLLPPPHEADLSSEDGGPDAMAKYNFQRAVRECSVEVEGNRSGGRAGGCHRLPRRGAEADPAFSQGVPQLNNYREARKISKERSGHGNPLLLQQGSTALDEAASEEFKVPGSKESSCTSAGGGNLSLSSAENSASVSEEFPRLHNCYPQPYPPACNPFPAATRTVQPNSAFSLHPPPAPTPASQYLTAAKPLPSSYNFVFPAVTAAAAAVTAMCEGEGDKGEGLLTLKKQGSVEMNTSCMAETDLPTSQSGSTMTWVAPQSNLFGFASALNTPGVATSKNVTPVDAPTLSREQVFGTGCLPEMNKCTTDGAGALLFPTGFCVPETVEGSGTLHPVSLTDSGAKMFIKAGGGELEYVSQPDDPVPAASPEETRSAALSVPALRAPIIRGASPLRTQAAPAPLQSLPQMVAPQSVYPFAAGGGNLDSNSVVRAKTAAVPTVDSQAVTSIPLHVRAIADAFENHKTFMEKPKKIGTKIFHNGNVRDLVDEVELTVDGGVISENVKSLRKQLKAATGVGMTEMRARGRSQTPRGVRQAGMVQDGMLANALGKQLQPPEGLVAGLRPGRVEEAVPAVVAAPAPAARASGLMIPSNAGLAQVLPKAKRSLTPPALTFCRDLTRAPGNPGHAVLDGRASTVTVQTVDNMALTAEPVPQQARSRTQPRENPFLPKRSFVAEDLPSRESELLLPDASVLNFRSTHYTQLPHPPENLLNDVPTSEPEPAPPAAPRPSGVRGQPLPCGVSPEEVLRRLAALGVAREEEDAAAMVSAVPRIEDEHVPDLMASKYAKVPDIAGTVCRRMERTTGSCSRAASQPVMVMARQLPDLVHALQAPPPVQEISLTGHIKDHFKSVYNSAWLPEPEIQPVPGISERSRNVTPRPLRQSERIASVKPYMPGTGMMVGAATAGWTGIGVPQAGRPGRPALGFPTSRPAAHGGVQTYYH